ncbi:exopolysaccharide biosynthesis polyprenyl glycosylphosphotransferase [uncultured Faecalibaculum sp.]|uniref:exopolysaccharide biosynthesis polyprenyl glycosylphosphotransferase n=1 Tax=uncultured Faecalibaculum sp. TaxID=1729681 RepID=UPI002629C1F0|nr:exopolysaccharide biosynthesis polyprenyl glycosylphosphotransferase [uncultured Faecalibaculum sp.]
MTKLGTIKVFIESGITILLLAFLPLGVGLKIKLYILWLIMQLWSGRYEGQALLYTNEMYLLLKSFGGMLITSLLVLNYSRGFPWNQFGWVCLFIGIDLLASLYINRWAHIWFWNKVKHNVLIVGAGPTATQLYNVCKTNRFSLMDVKGFINCNDDPFFLHNYQQVISQKLPVWKVKDIERIIEQQQIDVVLIAIPEMGRTDMNRLYGRIANLVDNIQFLPRVDGQINFASKINDFDGLLMISTSTGKISPLERGLKRAMDFIGSIPGLLVLIPLTAYVAVTNRKNGDKDPIFFVQERIGKDGKLFRMYKYRTMVPNAEQILQELMETDEDIRREYKINKKLRNDPRITKAGKFLREKSLDEFPQFINVFKGDMSLVGPRPYLPGEKEDMGEIYEDVIGTKPGITGMWQTHGRSDVTFEERLDLDSFYFRNYSLWLDITLLLRTVKTMLSKGEKTQAY